jgi:hypothetical protein
LSAVLDERKADRDRFTESVSSSSALLRLLPADRLVSAADPELSSAVLERL